MSQDIYPHDDVIKWKHLLAICAGNSPETGEFPYKRPETRSFDIFFFLRTNKRRSKQSWDWWFETPSRQCNTQVINIWLRNHRWVSYCVRFEEEFCINVYVTVDRIYSINTNKVLLFIILLCLYRNFIMHLWDIFPYLQQWLPSTGTECTCICLIGYKYISWYNNKNTNCVQNIQGRTFGMHVHHWSS